MLCCQASRQALPSPLGEFVFRANFGLVSEGEMSVEIAACFLQANIGVERVGRNPSRCFILIL